VAPVLVLTRRDGTTETAFIGSPYLAVLFEETFSRAPDTSTDAGWLAFVDRNDRPPEDNAELLAWLKQFIGNEVAEYQPPDPTAAAANGATPDASSPG
jgi:hypothetical protein